MESPAEVGGLDLGDEVIAFTRGAHFACVVNFGESPVDAPAGEVLIASEPFEGGLPRDTAAWIDLAQ